MLESQSIHYSYFHTFGGDLDVTGSLNLYLKIDNRALPARSARNYWQDNEQNHCKEAKHRYSSRYVSSNDEKYIETGAEK